MVFYFDFYTQYNQFYLVDGSSSPITDGDFWNEKAYENRLALNDGVIGIGTECYGPVKGEINILTQENPLINFLDYDHIVEGYIDIKSGALEVQDCPDSLVQLEINLSKGLYIVRIYSSNLESVDGDEGDDYYKIEIWPGEKISSRVLKKFN